jgi:hypothetical protein
MVICLKSSQSGGVLDWKGKTLTYPQGYSEKLWITFGLARLSTERRPTGEESLPFPRKRQPMAEDGEIKRDGAP